MNSVFADLKILEREQPGIREQEKITDALLSANDANEMVSVRFCKNGFFVKRLHANIVFDLSKKPDTHHYVTPCFYYQNYFLPFLERNKK